MPALVGVAAGLLAMRLLPLVTGLLARISAMRRDLVPVLAVRRQTRGGTTGPVLLVLMATASVGAFASATIAQVDRTAQAIAWQEVGAPTRTLAPGASLPSGFDPAALPGVEVVATAYEAPVTPSSGGVRQLLVIDAAAFGVVSRGLPVETTFPAAMLDPVAEEPLPAVVSSATGAGGDPVRTGDVFTVPIAGHTVELRAVSVRRSFPSIANGAPFVIVAREQVTALRPEFATPDDRLSANRAGRGALDPRRGRPRSRRTWSP